MRRLKARAGGSVNQDNVPHDEERHKTQKELILKNGLPTEPIILQKIGDKYELVEGWHRTIQLLSLFPDGYNYPNVYIGSFTPIVSMSHTSANGTTYADYK